MNFDVKVRRICIASFSYKSDYLASFDFGSDCDSISKLLHVSVEEIGSVSHSEANTISGKLVCSNCVQLCDCSIRYCVEKISFFSNDVYSKVQTICTARSVPGVFIAAMALNWEDRNRNCRCSY